MDTVSCEMTNTTPNKTRHSIFRNLSGGEDIIAIDCWIKRACNDSSDYV
jgi:hypothetical protein